MNFLPYIREYIPRSLHRFVHFFYLLSDYYFAYRSAGFPRRRCYFSVCESVLLVVRVLILVWYMSTRTPVLHAMNALWLNGTLITFIPRCEVSPKMHFAREVRILKKEESTAFRYALRRVVRDIRWKREFRAVQLANSVCTLIGVDECLDMSDVLIIRVHPKTSKLQFLITVGDGNDRLARVRFRMPAVEFVRLRHRSLASCRKKRILDWVEGFN